MERHAVNLELCDALLTIVGHQQWPNCLRDMAGGLLQSLAERWSNVAEMGGLQ